MGYKMRQSKSWDSSFSLFSSKMPSTYYRCVVIK